jgi:hypothetical protein
MDFVKKKKSLCVVWRPLGRIRRFTFCQDILLTTKVHIACTKHIQMLHHRVRRKNVRTGLTMSWPSVQNIRCTPYPPLPAVLYSNLFQIRMQHYKLSSLGSCLDTQTLELWYPFLQRRTVLTILRTREASLVSPWLMKTSFPTTLTTSPHVDHIHSLFPYWPYHPTSVVCIGGGTTVRATVDLLCCCVGPDIPWCKGVEDLKEEIGYSRRNLLYPVWPGYFPACPAWKKILLFHVGHWKGHVRHWSTCTCMKQSCSMTDKDGQFGVSTYSCVFWNTRIWSSIWFDSRSHLWRWPDEDDREDSGEKRPRIVRTLTRTSCEDTHKNYSTRTLTSQRICLVHWLLSGYWQILRCHTNVFVWISLIPVTDRQRCVVTNYNSESITIYWETIMVPYLDSRSLFDTHNITKLSRLDLCQGIVCLFAVEI